MREDFKPKLRGESFVVDYNGYSPECTSMIMVAPHPADLAPPKVRLVVWYLLFVLFVYIYYLLFY